MTVISSACSATDESVSAQAFWLKFRGEVIAGDKSKIAEMTNFPLHIHGVTDDIPVKECDRHCFDNMYDRLINQKIYFLGGEGVVQKTMLSVIAEQKTSGYDASVEKKGFRVHQFEFHQVSGKWLLTDAYLEE